MRLGTIADLEWALDLGAEIERAQAKGPSSRSRSEGTSAPRKATETLEDPEVRYFLVEHDGRPVAQCITFPLRARRGSFDATLHLSAVAVRESRGHGVGTALVDVALERARRHGFEYVETNWRVTNRAAARFWTGYGFEPTYVRLHRTVGAF